jgi:hypothetical protein
MLFRQFVAGDRIVVLGALRTPPWKLQKLMREVGLVRARRNEAADAAAVICGRDAESDASKRRALRIARQQNKEIGTEHEFLSMVAKMPRVLPAGYEMLRKLKRKPATYPIGF